MTHPDASDLMACAHDMADAARAAILPYFRAGDLRTDNKDASGFDPVTEADRAAERAMREILAHRRPDDAILGEEYGSSGGTSGLTWVLDPIDGTRGFMSGTPTWGVLIGLTQHRGRGSDVLLGMIDQPYIGERFWGGFGAAQMTGPQGARTLGVRQTTELTQAVLFTTFPEVGTPGDRAAFEAVAETVKLVRYGCDCYAYALLAAGQIDLVIEARLNAYDICGPVGVIQAAGGVVTNWQGAPVHEGGNAIAAATPELHAAALRIIKAMHA